MEQCYVKYAISKNTQYKFCFTYSQSELFDLAQKSSDNLAFWVVLWLIYNFQQINWINGTACLTYLYLEDINCNTEGGGGILKKKKNEKALLSSF